MLSVCGPAHFVNTLAHLLPPGGLTESLCYEGLQQGCLLFFRYKNRNPEKSSGLPEVIQTTNGNDLDGVSGSGFWFPVLGSGVSHSHSRSDERMAFADRHRWFSVSFAPE